MRPLAHRNLAPAARQRGLILFIVLIVLVAMSLAGIGMVRSVDTATMVAGNLGFKEASLNAGDQGIETAYQWLVANAGGSTLNNDNLAQGYYSSRPVEEPDWSDPDTWTDAAELNGGAQDGAGNVISYVIHRMCTQPNTSYNGDNAGVTNQCALTMPTAAKATGGSMSVGSFAFAGTPQVYYRVTSRIQGPRNTESFVQAMIAVTN
jgi:Tfp pilus assembly protein PilX